MMREIRAKAILPQYSAFVSASAGTGKTKTLIDRLLNLLLHQVKPHKILCLTFTKAAATEITMRINQKLAEFAICDRELLFKELTDLGFDNITLELEYKARILFAEFVDNVEPLNVQTIHAFCQQLLMKFPFEAGVNLNFNLLDENKITSLITQAKDILLAKIEQYPHAAQAVDYLSWHLKEYSLKELISEIIENREKLDHYFNSHNNLETILTELQAPDEEQYIADFIQNIPINDEHIAILANGGKTDNSNANELKQFIESNLSLQIMSINKYLSCFLTLTGEAKKFLLGKELKEEHLWLYQLLLSEQERVCQFNRQFKEIKTIHLTKSFTVFSYYIRQIYQQLKTDNNSLDYDDLISLTYDLLNNSEYADWIRYKLDGGIDHILVDEAQDNSSNQWEIINKICEEFYYQDGNKSIFIVGDAKQSIFSFQGAEPELFNLMNKNLPENILRLQLNHSFRSGREILKLVDKIFNQAHIKPLVTGIENNIEHIAYKDLEGSVELWPLIIDPEMEAKKAWQLPGDLKGNKEKTGYEQLAVKIATEIEQWLMNKKFIHSKGRTINPGDIMVLTRRRNDFVNCLIKELRELSIPVSGIDRLKLLEHPIVLDLIALAKVLLCPADDLNLAILLKSPIYNFSEEQLFDLCKAKKGNLWEELKDEFLIELQSLVSTKSVFEFYFYILEYKGLRKAFAQYSEADDVLDAFLDLILQFEADNISSLQLFLEFLSNSKIEVKRDVSHHQPQVKIRTIHGAKGLQAPIVILADTTTLPHSDDSIIWLDQEKFLWPGKVKYYSDEAHQAKKEKSDKEYAEYLRLLYVALTRAEDELIICGSTKKEQISPKCWYSIIQENILDLF